MNLKRIIGKTTALFAATLVIHSNCYMFGLGISKVIAQDIKEPNVNLKLENIQYVQFNEEIKTDEAEETVTEENQETEKQYNSGVAIKTKLQLSLEEQETQLSIKSSEFVISMPTINGCLPQRANVVKANTSLTTGEADNQKINQNYDSNSGLLNVSYGNDDTYSQYNKESKDEFEIIYIYPAQAYTGNEEEISLQYSVVAKVNFETENASTTSEKVEGIELKEKENKGSLLTFQVTKLDNNIYKGFMYANIENGNNYDTDYNTVSSLCVLNSNNIDELIMETKESTFLLNDENNTQINSEGNLLYKSTGISKTEFDKILGQDGSIEIYENETLLATLKYIEVSENKEVTKKLSIIYSNEDIRTLSNEETIAKIEYGEGVKNLTIKTTKPISEGYINFQNENTIKASQDYKVEVSKIKGINTTSEIKGNTKNVELPLLEPQTKISVDSSNVNFSTLQTSNTTLTIKLDATNASTKLFNNPTITITLPEGLICGNLSSPEIVNGNGLSIKNADAVKNVITIELEGKQTNYDLTNVSGGASIVMDIENIDFEDTLPTHTDKIEVTCSQNKEQVKATKDVNIISKAGLLILSNVTGFDNNEKIRSIDSSVNTVEISNEAEQKEIVQTINLVNNYNEKITNTQIIGKIGYINEELNSTFDLELAKKIEVENAKVYYSTNKDATYNDQSWTEEFTNQAKAYKIELEGSELASKQGKEIKVTLKIPANLGYNNESYIRTQVNYTSNQQNLNDSTTFGIVTPFVEIAGTNIINNTDSKITEYSNLEIGTQVTLGGEVIDENFEINEGQMLRYYIILKNNGNEAIKDLNLQTIIENAVYYEIDVIGDASGSPATGYVEKDATDKIRNKTIELNPYENKIIEYQVKVNENVNNIKNTVVITKDDKTIYQKEINNNIKEANLKVKIESEYNEEELIYGNSECGFTINVTNISDDTLKRVKVSCKLPEEFNYDITDLDAYFWSESEKEFDKIEKDESTNTLYWTINTIEVGKTVHIYVRPSVSELDDTIIKKDIKLIANVEHDNNVFTSNDLIKTIYQNKTGIVANISTNIETEKVLNNAEKILFNIEIKNEGNQNLKNVSIMVDSNENLRIEKYINEEDNKECASDSDDYFKIENIKLNRGETKRFKIYTTVNIEDETDEDFANLNVVVLDDLGNTITTESMHKVNIQVNNNKENDEKYDIQDDGEIEEDNVSDDLYGVITSPEDTIINTGEIFDKEGYINYNDNDKDNSDNGDSGTNNKKDNNDNSIPGEDEGKDDNGVSSGNEKDENDNNNSGNEGNENQNGDNENNQEKNLYEIKGIVWLDSNKDGKRDETEISQQNIQVSIVNATTGNYVTDKNGNKMTTTTNSEGKYTFTNLEEGKYIVIFEFDTNKYTVTTYQKTDIGEEQNSDAILSTVTINGESKLMGITDTIELKSNKENIDIGLIENAKFNLSLDKKITKITVVNKQGTQTYEYKNGHTAKVDLVAKYMAGSEVIVTYKFTITNEGEVTGYVNSLMDSLPSGLEFNSEMNKNWYKDSDGNLYTTSLSGIAIKPGETSEIELVLNKTMTEENAGTFVNSAKLVKISNLENIAESETAIEDNESSAMLIISIKTGSIILYLGITLMCLAIIGVGTYMINKKVLNKEI